MLTVLVSSLPDPRHECSAPPDRCAGRRRLVKRNYTANCVGRSQTPKHCNISETVGDNSEQEKKILFLR